MSNRDRKTWFITGTSSGFGHAFASYALEKGYNVVATARKPESLESLVAQAPDRALALTLDVDRPQDAEAAVSAAVERFGRIDVLINNAGFGSYGAVEDVSMADARYQLDVNLFGLARLTQLVLPYMRRQHAGKIVNVTSIGGKMAAPLGGWYHASKFAVEGLSDSLRIEVKPFGIDVILIEPGGVKTEWGGIAMDNLRKVSGETAYKDLAGRMAGMAERIDAQNVDPSVIAALILRAIEAKKPKARYVKGYLAGPILFMKRWLSDAQFDKMIAGQIK